MAQGGWERTAAKGWDWLHGLSLHALSSQAGWKHFPLPLSARDKEENPPALGWRPLSLHCTHQFPYLCPNRSPLSITLHSQRDQPRRMGACLSRQLQLLQKEPIRINENIQF